MTLTLPSNMSPVPEIASPTNVTKHRFFFFLQNYTHFSNTGKQIDLCVRWSVAASNQLLSPCYQSIYDLFIVLGLLSDFPCRTWRIGTLIEIWLYLYCMTNIYLWLSGTLHAKLYIRHIKRCLRKAAIAVCITLNDV